MEIMRRLSREELSDLMLQSDQRSLGPALEKLPENASTMTEQPEEFWQRQRIAIWGRISDLERRSISRWPLFAAAAGILIVAFFVAFSGHRPVVTPQAKVDSDHELLLNVEQTMQSDGPDALQPAALLAQEMEQYGFSNSDMKVNFKETSNEN